MQAPVIYAIAGKIGVGKDFVGAALVAELVEHMDGAHRPMLLALGDGLKHHILREHPDILYDEVFGRKTPRSRHLLQTVAMEIREKHGDGAWVKELFNVIDMHFKRGNATHFIVTDMRFLVEARALKERGATIVLVEAPSRNMEKLMQESGGDRAILERIANHVSEKQMDSPEFRELVTMVINNDSTEPLVLEYMLHHLAMGSAPVANAAAPLEHVAIRSYILMHVTPTDVLYSPSFCDDGAVNSSLVWKKRAALSIETRTDACHTQIRLLNSITKEWHTEGWVTAADHDKMDRIIQQIRAAQAAIVNFD